MPLMLARPLLNGWHVSKFHQVAGTAVDRVHLACRLNHEVKHDGYERSVCGPYPNLKAIILKCGP